MPRLAPRLIIVTPKAYTVSEAATLLGVDRATAYRMIRDGELRYCTVRSKLLVPADAITDYLQQSVDVTSGGGVPPERTRSDRRSPRASLA